MECLSTGMSQISLQGASSVDTALQEIRNVYAGRDDRRHVPLQKANLPGCAMKEFTKPMESQGRTGTQW